METLKIGEILVTELPDVGLMRITKRSPATNTLNSMDLPVTKVQLEEFLSAKTKRRIQDIFPQLTPAQREFIRIGYTPEDDAKAFDEIFGSSS